MKWSSDLCKNISNYIFRLLFLGTIYIEESCGELYFRLVSNDVLCSSRNFWNSQEQSSYWDGRYLGNLCVRIFHYVIQGLSTLKNLIRAHILLQNFVTTKFNIILPFKFTSVECSHCSELKRILFSKICF
jgi:hypothetical protein